MLIRGCTEVFAIMFALELALMLRFTTVLCATLLIAAPTYAASGGCMRDRETAEIVPQEPKQETEPTDVQS